MPLITGISQDAAKALVDELAAKYPATLLSTFADELVSKLKDAEEGLTITITVTISKGGK